MVWVKLVAVSVAALGLVWALVAGLGAALWRGRVAEWQRKVAAAEVAVAGRYDPAMLAGLPAPVARYLGLVLEPGQAMVSRVSMAHEGMFDMGRRSRGGVPFPVGSRLPWRGPVLSGTGGFRWGRACPCG